MHMNNSHIVPLRSLKSQLFKVIKKKKPLLFKYLNPVKCYILRMPSTIHVVFIWQHVI